MTPPYPEPGDRPPLLTAEQEQQLALAIEVGVLAEAALTDTRPGSSVAPELTWLVAEGRRAWLRFVQANLGLVRVFAVREARRCGLPEADFFQEGCVALMVAVQRYDHRRGVRFSSYAVPWIRSAVSLAGARRCGEVNLPPHRAGQLRRTRAAQNALTLDLGRMPSTAELGASLDRDEGWVAGMLAHHATSVELDQRIEGRHGAEDRALEGVLDRGAGSGLLELLPDAQRQVLAVRFGFTGGRPRSRREAAVRLGLGRRRVRVLEEQALATLRLRLEMAPPVGLEPTTVRLTVGSSAN